MTSRIRPSKEQSSLRVAKVIAERSNCMRRQIGAVVVINDRIVATGYNGTPRGMMNCFDGGCPRCNNQGEAQSGQNLSECLCIHAEENCITSAAFHGVSLKGGTIFTMLTPCLLCSKLIINSGIRCVIYANVYPINGLDFLAKAGVQTHQIDPERKAMRQVRTSQGYARIDNKHHIQFDSIFKTTNGQMIPDEEPRILFRGRDKFSLPLLKVYRQMCADDGATEYQLANMDSMIAEFEEFAKENPGTMKQPGITLGR